MGDYYFLGTALPELQIDVPPELSFYDFNTLLKENLSLLDLKQTKILRRYYDILNIEALWKEDELLPYGNWSKLELEEVLLGEHKTPPYFQDFLDRYPHQDEKVKNFPRLLADYFKNEALITTGFLHEYLSMERELRLVFVAFRAKKLGRDLLTALQYENPDEEFIAQMIAQKDAKEYEPPEKYELLKPIFEENSDDPQALYQALLHYRFEAITKMVGVEMFSMNKILGYLAQLIIIEQSLQLDKSRGVQVVDTIVERNT